MTFSDIGVTPDLIAALAKQKITEPTPIQTVAYPVLSALMRRMDYRRYNGAALLGLRGLVFKSHGSADVLAFEQALNRAYDAARNNLLDRVRAQVAHAAPLLATADTQRAP